MTIHEATEETIIAPGNWVCPTPMTYDRICDAPRKVASTSGKRVYLLETDGTNQGNFIARKSCVYVCDTEQEAAAVYAISREQADSIAASNDVIRAVHRSRIRALNAGGVSA